ncbi:GTP-binding protein, putative [Plasmodium sp. gorilla clade G2]|uniref:GTP-binding protein, putative n=1 Tax=Plasmodium sp. gorilla clade G2 TaxID=880535 RepID=UPI000D21B51F|nr:GTP-binding protein, putative [Plasmodium sp. gorilla clade G2]SOV19338.1 GTP-binding protein, putative [Plasmodium sp. gorilla clade G2]
MNLINYTLRRYSSLQNSMRVENLRRNVNMINDEMLNYNCYMSKRKREKSLKLDMNIYEQLKRKMIGKPLNKLQKKYMNEKRPNFAPIFLDQLKPRMVLYKTAIQVNELPLPKYPEIAFIGRSNCGKSTLINELCGRTNKAKVSKIPGCTKEIHFYKIGKPCLMCLVDLPGYGYAESKEELRLQWNEFTLFYLKNRKNLKKVFILIDCRVGLKTSDKELLHFFDRYNIKYQIVLSKCDLLNTKDLAIKIQIINQDIVSFKNLEKPLIPLSSIKKQNLDELRNEIARYQLNKTIVKNNIVMKINDLIEQKRLKKLKNQKDKTLNMNLNINNNTSANNITHINNHVEDNNLSHTLNNSNINEHTKIDIVNPNTNINNPINNGHREKSILISDQTIFEALNRWNNTDTNKYNYNYIFNFNTHMNNHIKYLISSLHKKFISECLREYNINDLQIIDNIIHQEIITDDKTEEKHVTMNNKENKNITNANKYYPNDYKINTYLYRKQNKYRNNKKKQVECHNMYDNVNCINYSYECNYNPLSESLDEDDNHSNQLDEKMILKNDLHTNRNDKILDNENYISNKENNNINNNSQNIVEKKKKKKNIDIFEENCKDEKNENVDILCKGIIKDIMSNEEKMQDTKETYDEFKNNNFINDKNNIEKELFEKSLFPFDLSQRKNQDNNIFSENIQMNNLFNYQPETNPWNNLFKKKDYKKINEDILLQEEDTYDRQDYISGLKRPPKENSKSSLYNYSFNIKDKSTHYIYEKNKSDSYKIYKSRQLEDIHDQLKDNLIDTQKRKTKENGINGDHVNAPNDSSKNHFNKRNIKVDSSLCKINKDESVNEEKNEYPKKKIYIGLKTRSKIIRGTKKLKLFGKKKKHDIVNTPIDLATDYFKLNNNSTFYDKKKNSWNYINAKYNKWMKKSNRKNIASEIPLSPIKKEEVMKRYVEKQETKYTKEKNKFLRQKKNLGMISKPPNHKNKKSISKNYSLSDEQKIFDREAFFKYRDVQK